MVLHASGIKELISKDKNQYVILGVTGPNEYENNVNNNFYTNFIAKWCIDYTYEQLQFSMDFRLTTNVLLKKLNWQTLN
jgi:maltose phosphorylase